MMKFNIDTMIRFKNWFFGIVENPIVLEYETERLADEVFVNNVGDLPEEGDPTISYRVTDLDTNYQFKDGAYYPIDPYVFGVDPAYREKPHPIRIAEKLTDQSYYIPDSSDAKIKAGYSPNQAVLFNVMALRLDLEQLRRVHVQGTKHTLMDVMSIGKLQDKADNVTAWFIKEHAILHRLLKSAYKSKKAFNQAIVDIIYNHGYVFTWDDLKNRPVLKVNDFTVHI